MNEVIGRRILGAIRCVDATTGNAVTGGISATGGPLALKMNRSGVFVIFGGGGLQNLTADIIPTGTVWRAATSFEISLQDPKLFYLPRRAMVKAPQATSATDTLSLGQAQSIRVYRGPSARVEPTWAVIHASIALAGALAGASASAPGLPWAVVLVKKSADQSILATGMADRRGEALVAVPGLSIQVSATGSGAVLQSTVAVTVEVLFDPSATAHPADWIPNPDDILANPAGPWKTASQAAQLSAGQTLFLKFAVSV